MQTECARQNKKTNKFLDLGPIKIFNVVNFTVYTENIGRTKPELECLVELHYFWFKTIKYKPF